MYQQKFPNIKITRNYGNMADLFAKLTTQAVSGAMPDLTGMVAQQIGNFADKDLLVDLKEYADKGALDLSKFTKTALISGTYKGKLYMVSGGDTANILGYNKTQLDKMGILVPKSQMTWDEYTAYAKSIKAKLPNSNSWAVMNDIGSEFQFENFIRQNGYELTTPDGKDVGYPKEIVSAWYKYWKDMQDQGLVPPPNVMAENVGKAYQDTIQYKGLVMCFSQNLNQIKINQAVLKDELGAVRLPVVANAKNKDVELLQPSAFSIPKSSKVKDEAVILLNWFVNDQEVQKVFNMEWGVPASSEIDKMLLDGLKPDDPIDRAKQIEINLMSEIGNSVISHPGRQAGCSAILSDMAKKGETVIHGTETPDQAADAHIKSAKQILGSSK